VLVAEVMAQQTQVGRVEAAWPAFTERFPTPARLAAAPTADVLRAWSGLGYNRRALLLQRAARAIVSDHDGRVPGEVDTLETIPGIGPYTARAVAAIAFGRPVAAVDTNIRRVVGRLVGRPDETPARLQAIADGLVDRSGPAAWTHALMDLGATVCRARRPLCDACPWQSDCASAGRVGIPSGDGEGEGDVEGEGDARRRRGGPAFEQSTRWLRGRVVARLREADGDAWTHLPGVIGSHGPEAVHAALDALVRDGLIERRADGAVRLPSGSS
jgi:A/G-specific adenine glycosylase